jgi:tripartite-type tricarboxylate transporter receptor subunit TctC
VQSADYKGMIEKTGSVAVSSTPEELARVLADTFEQTERVSREFGLQL